MLSFFTSFPLNFPYIIISILLLEKAFPLYYNYYY